ncbi:MAG TPA: hypothetical protein VMW38_05915 [Terriglobia bacterium]|nr:hypothetical protein [Terriglobia bacterium]
MNPVRPEQAARLNHRLAENPAHEYGGNPARNSGSAILAYVRQAGIPPGSLSMAISGTVLTRISVAQARIVNDRPFCVTC